MIPCFNEAERLDPAAITAFADSNPVDLILVDDGSTDHTLRLLESLAAHPRIDVLPLTRNAGKGEAVRQGLLRALDGASPYVGYFDADLSTPLAAWVDLAAPLDSTPSFELAIGSRVQLLGRRIERDQRRHYLGRVFATTVSRMLGLRVYDTQCGAKLFRRETVQPLLQEPFLTRWLFDVELLARWINTKSELRPALEQQIAEVPLQWWVDRGDSRIRTVDALRVPWDLMRIQRHYLRRSPSGG